MQLYKAILAKYGSSVAGGIGSFSQMGFLLGKFLVQALETVKGPYTIKSVNAAIQGIKDYKTEMLCQPWTYGKVALHIPNNTDYTTTPDNGKMVTAQGCTNDLLGRSADRRSTARRRRRPGSIDGELKVDHAIGALSVSANASFILMALRCPSCGRAAVHRHRAGARGGVRPVRRGDDRAVPGDRGAEPGVRCGGGDRRPDRMAVDQPLGLRPVAGLPGVHRCSAAC